MQKIIKNLEKCFCIIPARSGSKGLVGKNLKKLGGRELFQWSVDAANFLNIEYADALQYIQSKNRGQGFGTCPTNAGCATIFGELGSLFEVLSESPIFGYGARYSFGDIYRPMALNGVVEVVLRWGLLGLIMFFGFMLRKRIDRYRLFVFILFFLIAFGNIGQPLFWVLLSLIYIAHSKPILHNKNIRQLNG